MVCEPESRFGTEKKYLATQGKQAKLRLLLVEFIMCVL